MCPNIVFLHMFDPPFLNDKVENDQNNSKMRVKTP